MVEAGGSRKDLPGSVMVAHQNLGLSVKVRILAGQLAVVLPCNINEIANRKGLIRPYNLRSLYAP